MKYAVRYEETLAKTVIVEADSLDEAIEKVANLGVVLDYDDYDSCDTMVAPYANKDGTATKNQLKNCEVFEE